MSVQNKKTSLYGNLQHMDILLLLFLEVLELSINQFYSFILVGSVPAIRCLYRNIKSYERKVQEKFEAKHFVRTFIVYQMFLRASL